MVATIEGGSKEGKEEEDEGVEAWGAQADAKWHLLVAAVKKVRCHFIYKRHQGCCFF
jgi:hypothetical protein